jgi:hypothetical protein
VTAIRFAEDEIIGVLREPGAKTADICRNKSLDIRFFDEPTKIV